MDTSPPTTEAELVRRIDLAMRAIAFLLGITAALVAAFTGLGSWFDLQQAQLMNGSYYPKLTMLICIIIVGGPVFFIVYLPLKKLWAPKLVARLRTKLGLDNK